MGGIIGNWVGKMNLTGYCMRRVGTGIGPLKTKKFAAGSPGNSNQNDEDCLVKGYLRKRSQDTLKDGYELRKT